MTTLNGAMVEAESTVGVKALSAMPSEQSVAVPSTT